MPTYTYQCTECQHTFDLFQSMKDEPIKTCEKCKKNSVQRLIGAGAGFLFKGSGFYITDYRSKSYQEKAKSDGVSSSSTPSSDKSTGSSSSSASSSGSKN